MCRSATVIISLLLIIKTNADTEDNGGTFNNIYAPATLKFNDIFTNSLSLLAEDPNLTTNTKDEDYRLHSISTKFVEFHPQIDTTTKNIKPPPQLTSIKTFYSKKLSEPPEEKSVQVIPIKKNYQRGVLDLLFPASRVRAFKNVFDTFRRILSHTFRRR